MDEIILLCTLLEERPFSTRYSQKRRKLRKPLQWLKPNLLEFFILFVIGKKLNKAFVKDKFEHIALNYYFFNLPE